LEGASKINYARIFFKTNASTLCPPSTVTKGDMGTGFSHIQPTGHLMRFSHSDEQMVGEAVNLLGKQALWAL
jgi:hypothetical protein